MENSLTLLELNGLVREVLEQTLDEAYWLVAELSECRVAGNGHCYVEFVQKDAAGRALVARARGIVWARTYAMLAPLFERATGERLRAGMKVRVQVTVEFHELYGYSLNVVDIDPSFTLGDMAKRRREILAQLQADGILEDNKSLPLPTLLKRIAVVSSASAAGYGDFCNQLEHNPEGLCFEVRLFPAVMQGEHVEASVLAALEAICDEADRWDCVVIIRGGGATSDLSDFDTYALASAVAQMPLPVIVGIGHERDETVLDFVAHTRVKTPTAAAAFLIDHQARLLTQLTAVGDRIEQRARRLLHEARTTLDRMTLQLPRAFALVSERQGRQLDRMAARIALIPRQRIADERHRVDRDVSRLFSSFRLVLQGQRSRLDLMSQRVNALDPALQLKRGFSLTFDAEGRLLKSISSLSKGDSVVTRLADGEVTSVVADFQKQKNVK